MDILIHDENGVAAVTVPVEGFSLDDLITRGDVPAGAVKARRVDLPKDRLFRAAWRVNGGAVAEDMETARAIAHERRREARAREFAPHDIAATIPDQAAAAEAARQAIRDRYAVIQTDMDNAATVDELRAHVLALPGGGI